MTAIGAGVFVSYGSVCHGAGAVGLAAAATCMLSASQACSAKPAQARRLHGRCRVASSHAAEQLCIMNAAFVSHSPTAAHLTHSDSTAGGGGGGGGGDLVHASAQPSSMKALLRVHSPAAAHDSHWHAVEHDWLMKFLLWAHSPAAAQAAHALFV